MSFLKTGSVCAYLMGGNCVMGTQPGIKSPPSFLAIGRKDTARSLLEPLVDRSKFSNNRSRDFPTVFVVDDSGSLCALTGRLRSKGYFVLESDRTEAVTVARMHSRAIHLLLMDGSAESRTLAAQLRLYRAKMQVLFVALDDTQLSLPNVVPPEFVLERVRQFFEGGVSVRNDLGGKLA